MLVSGPDICAKYLHIQIFWQPIIQIFWYFDMQFRHWLIGVAFWSAWYIFSKNCDIQIYEIFDIKYLNKSISYLLEALGNWTCLLLGLIYTPNILWQSCIQIFCSKQSNLSLHPEYPENMSKYSYKYPNIQQNIKFKTKFDKWSRYPIAVLLAQMQMQKHSYTKIQIHKNTEYKKIQIQIQTHKNTEFKTKWDKHPTTVLLA